LGLLVVTSLLVFIACLFVPSEYENKMKELSKKENDN